MNTRPDPATGGLIHTRNCIQCGRAFEQLGRPGTLRSLCSAECYAERQAYRRRTLRRENYRRLRDLGAPIEVAKFGSDGGRARFRGAVAAVTGASLEDL